MTRKRKPKKAQKPNISKDLFQIICTSVIYLYRQDAIPWQKWIINSFSKICDWL